MKEWQKENTYYFGKHDKREPVNVFGGYRYNASRNGNELVTPSIWDAVIRAIPADGAVSGKPSWEKSPQAKFWLDQPKPTVMEKILARIRRPRVPVRDRIRDIFGK